MHWLMRVRMSACYARAMPKTVQIRDLDDDVYAALARRAAEAGISVPEVLRLVATRIAARPTVDEWLARTRRRSSSLGRLEVISALDEQRGSWPDDRR
jgi:plasmid stability protein